MLLCSSWGSCVVGCRQLAPSVPSVMMDHICTVRLQTGFAEDYRAGRKRLSITAHLPGEHPPEHHHHIPTRATPHPHPSNTSSPSEQHKPHQHQSNTNHITTRATQTTSPPELHHHFITKVTLSHNHPSNTITIPRIITTAQPLEQQNA